MALKASLVISGDADGATAALHDVDQALEQNAAAARRAANENENLGRKVEVSARQASAGYINLGRQAQDVAVQLQGGTNIGTIIAQQGGQVADAVAQMGGRFAGFASFLAGPWGAAIIVGVGLLANLAEAMWKSSEAGVANADALKKVEAASDGLGSAQGVLGQMFDLTTGKIQHQTEMLRLNAQAMALNLRAEALGQAASSKAALGFNQGSTGLSVGKKVLGAIGFDVSDSFGRGEAVGGLARDLQAGRITREQALAQSDKLDFSGLSITKQQFQQAILDDLSAKLKTQTADLIDKSIADKSLAPALRKAISAGKIKQPKDTSKAAAALGEFGEDTAAKIAGIRDQFSDLPAAIGRSRSALRQLDDIASDVERRKPPNYAAILTDLAGARQAVEDSLLKPFDEYLDRARQAEAIDRLLIAGREDEADALKDALALEKAIGPLSQDQLQTVLDTVQAERQRSAELERQQAIIGAYLEATRSVRSELEAVLSGQGKLGNFKTIFAQLQGKVLTERIFGDAFRELEDQIKGENGPLRTATDRFASATGRASTAATDLASAFVAAGGTIRAAAVGGGVGALTGGQAAANDNAELVASLKQATDEIVVVAPRLNPLKYADAVGARIASSITGSLDQSFGTSFFGKLAPQLAGGIAGYITGGVPGGLLGVAKTIKGLPQGLTDALGKAGAGAATGTTVAGIGKSLGLKLSTTGSQIGGAIGSALPIPGGEIIGAIAGGLIGSLFKKTQKGGATIGAGSDGLGITGTFGNSAERIKAGSDAAGSVISSVNAIAEKLGASVDASLGSVSVGLYKDKYRVSTSGASKLGGYSGSEAQNESKYGLYNFGDDQAGAIAFAVADLLKDGVVTGVSAAVKKALTSSPDVDKAVTEALKVQDLELAIGGIGAQLTKAFKDFERQAADRLRIASEYGFDVVAVEKRNAEDRLKLSQQLLEQQVGSLKALIDDLTTGSLFEGSALDQRQALLGAIGSAKADADAGTEGAADTLAGLLRQLNDVSKDAYGTTGGFAADRATILDQARDTLAQANQRIADADKAATSDPALSTTNAALDENNDQNAQILAALGLNNDYLAQIATGQAVGDYSRLSALAGIGLP